MVRFLWMLVCVWQNRVVLFLPFLLFPLALLLVSAGRETTYTYTTTIHLNDAMLSSPFLQDVRLTPGVEMFERVLANPDFLLEALTTAGLVAESSTEETKTAAVHRLMTATHIQPAGPHTLQMVMRTADNQNARQILDTLSVNFVQELLAPERFRLEQKAATLAEQIKYYATRHKEASDSLQQAQAAFAANNTADLLKEVVSQEFEVSRLAAQQAMAQQEYDQTMEKGKLLLTQYGNQTNGNQTAWMVEPPVQTAVSGGESRHLSYMLCGVVLAAMVSFLLLVWQMVQQRGVVTSGGKIKDMVGLRVVGHIPDMGEIKVENGHLSAALRTSL